MVQFKLLSKKALAADTYTYDAPTEPMKVDGKILQQLHIEQHLQF